MVSRAIILAAGRGTRLGALTADRPKPMVPLRGRPVLEHILQILSAVGISEFVLVVGYRAEVIQDYFQDGSAWGWRIAYAVQPRANGTGAALLAAREMAGSDPFLASFGDIITEESHYRALVESFHSAPCAAAIGINPLPDVSAGAAVTLDGNRIVKVTEKPPPGTASSHWNLAGVSIYGPTIWDALAALRPSARGEYEITDAIESLIQSGQEVRAVKFEGFWSDIGTPEALREAEARIGSG